MSKRVAAFFTAAALLLSAPVAAQRQIDLVPGEAWIHESTGFGFAPRVDGFDRQKLNDYGKTESDISFSYFDRSTGTTATVYVFRAGLPDVVVWGDRAEESILINAPKYYGDTSPAQRRWSAFSPWANSRNAGLRVVYPLSGKSLKSTGLALARHGDWLIKIRMSSQRLDTAQLETRMSSFFTALGFPAPRMPGKPVYQLKPCANPLPAARVNQVRLDGQNANLPALFTPPALPDSRPFCRETTTITNVTVYRPGGSMDTYVMALGDGGNSVLVRPGPKSGNAPGTPFVAAAFITNDRIIGFPAFDATPGWAQLYEVAERGRPSFEIDRTGSKGKPD